MDSNQDSDQESDQESQHEWEYSREATVAAVQDFIAFATIMYLDETAYESPPSTGWPSITPESMRLFGKTDAVIDLLRHLPYPSDTGGGRKPQVMPALAFPSFQLDAADFGQSEQGVIDYRMLTEGNLLFERIQPHLVGLTERPRNEDGILLDTKLGLVYWDEIPNDVIALSPFPVVFGLDSLLYDEDEEGETVSPDEPDWREGCDTVWSIPDFFATLKHNFKELHFVPISRRRVVEGWYGYGSNPPDKRFQEAVDMVKGIYRAYGWPDLERYRKEDCLKAIHVALRENFPGEEDWEDD